MQQEAIPTSDRPFQLGLVLAGAISAGAYTAGVIDFLFQALAEWEDNRGKPGVPDHRVVLKVIAGASAGAITGALGAVALARGLAPREFSREEVNDRYPDRYRTHQRFQCALQSLYRTWVVLPAMVRGDGGREGLLGGDDLNENPILRSLLNAAVLDQIKRAAIEPLDEQSGRPLAPPLPYVATRLHLYNMISNMRGIPYKIQFGEKTTYGMQTIGDRIHYVITDLGSTNVSEPDSWVERDAAKASIPISVTTLPKRIGDPLKHWDRFGTAALASGAFPLGLASRSLAFAWPHYLERLHPVETQSGLAIRPDFPEEITGSIDTFNFESLDGGIVNNNPFDYAQFALIGASSNGPTSAASVERANVMVAPFPDPPQFLPEGSPSPAFAAIARALLPALLNQARFRSSDLAPAVDERDHSRFLIAPLRRVPRTVAPANPGEEAALERYAIACGLLGGFGGFLDEKFRAHDFQLGRRNCQQFLRMSFLVDAANVTIGRPGQTGKMPVIPLIGSAADPIPLPRWPQMSAQSFSILCDRLADRIDLIAPRLLDAEVPKGRLRTAARLVWRFSLRSRVISFVQKNLLADLVRRRQIIGWDPTALDSVVAQYGGRTPEDAQAVIAELIDTKARYRSANRIAAKTHLPVPFVTAVLNALCAEEIDGPARAWKDEWGFMLFSNRPGRIRRSWLARWAARRWAKPDID
jgi:hypothetical protein